MTLAEMRKRMSERELLTWQGYAERNGPLSLALRIEGAVARALTPWFKDAKVADFMPWPVREDDETGMESMTAEQARALGWKVAG